MGDITLKLLPCNILDTEFWILNSVRFNKVESHPDVPLRGRIELADDADGEQAGMLVRPLGWSTESILSTQSIQSSPHTPPVARARLKERPSHLTSAFTLPPARGAVGSVR